jgi:hypothetical protein
VRLEELVARRDRARDAAHTILEIHEAAASRVVALTHSFKNLGGLPVDVAEYYRESLNALQVGCYRAAIVMSWAGFIHTVTEHMVSHHQAALITHYPKWDTGTTEELLESTPEAQILEAGKKITVFNNQTLNIYKGWLSTRNQSAHPTLYQPSRNVALGFVDAVIREVAKYI